MNCSELLKSKLNLKKLQLKLKKTIKKYWKKEIVNWMILTLKSKIGINKFIWMMRIGNILFIKYRIKFSK